MHERKKLMADLADAFLALPGDSEPGKNFARP
jgi:predicted Rossmann-fold nucleotide-binding protein